MDTVKVMISIPKPLLEAVDQMATAEHRSRSELFREAARRYLGERDARRRPLDDPHVRQAIALMEKLAGRDRPAPEWDTVDAVRRERQRERACAGCREMHGISSTARRQAASPSVRNRSAVRLQAAASVSA